MNTRRWIAIGVAAVAVTTATATATSEVAAAATTSAQHAYRQQDLQRDLAAITAAGVPGVLAEVRIGAAAAATGHTKATYPDTTPSAP